MPFEEPTWKCPKGFLAVAEAGLQPWQMPGCVPALAECGADPFGGLGDAAGRVFALAAATGPADGTRAQPFGKLAAAVAAAPSGGEVVVGEGIYPESVLIDKTLTVRGRCPFLVAVVAQATGPALRVKGAAAQAVTVRDLSLGGASAGLYVDASATAVAHGVFVTNATGSGVVAAKSGAVKVVDSVIAETTPGAEWHGQGAWVTSGGQMSLHRVRLSRNHAAGVLAVGTGSAVTATDVLVEDVRPASSGMWGRGFDVASGARAELTEVRVVGARDIGLRAGDAGTRVEADRLHVRVTRAQKSDGIGGDALHVRDGATLRVRHVKLTANRRAGAFAIGTGSTLELGNALVVATAAEPAAKADSSAIAAQAGGHVLATGVVVADTVGVGLLANDPDARIEVTAGLVRDTLPSQSTGSGGYGAVAQFGGWMSLNGVRLHHNRELGVSIHGADSFAALRAVVVDETIGAELGASQTGIGVKVSGGASCAMDDVRVSHNRAAGIVVGEAGSALLGQRVLVDRTASMAGFGVAGYGLSVREGAAVDLRTVRLFGNHSHGAFVLGAKTRLVLRDALVDGTLPRQADGTLGFGIAAGDSATVELLGARLHANRGFAVLAQGPAGLFVGRDLCVTATMPDDSLQAGRAVAAELGARLDLRGVRIIGAIDAAVTAVGGAQARLVGVRADGTLSDLNGVGGLALECFDKGKLDVVACRFAGSHTAAMLFENCSVSVTGSALLQTAGAKMLTSAGATAFQFGDGLIASKGSALLVRDSLFAGNLRAGILALGPISVQLIGVVATGNAWGVVLQKGAKMNGKGNALVANTMQNEVSQGGLSVPAAPKLVPTEAESAGP